MCDLLHTSLHVETEANTEKTNLFNVWIGSDVCMGMVLPQWVLFKISEEHPRPFYMGVPPGDFKRFHEIYILLTEGSNRLTLSLNTISSCLTFHV